MPLLRAQIANDCHGHHSDYRQDNRYQNKILKRPLGSFHEIDRNNRYKKHVAYLAV